MPVTDGGDELVVESVYLGPAHAGMQRIIESALYVFQETRLDRCTKMIVHTKVVSLLEASKHKDGKGEERPVS